ncbi:hypothetical protein QBC39DRAFT_413190 [Podospora conica]|nr:hypothetical protein QBC39DRAFT_413190 [Schizothecium conicum]
MRILTQRLPLARAPALLRFASIQRQLPFRHPSSPSSIAPDPDTGDIVPPSITHIHPVTLEQDGLRWKYDRLATADAAAWLAPRRSAAADYDDMMEYRDDQEPEEPEVELDDNDNVMHMQRGNHHGEVKGNPTQSEANVWADRTDEDPLLDDVRTLHEMNTIELPAGEAETQPTDSEERVRADRAQDDPMKAGGYC